MCSSIKFTKSILRFSVRKMILDGILECEIEELSANENISLPAFIFYDSDNDFDIEYEINSKGLSTKVQGVLSVKI